MSGSFFDLHCPEDLLAKLRRELERMRDDPGEVDHAYNFFVTAEHLLDWSYPGDSNEKTRRRLRGSEVLLRVTSNLANGAKHFSLRDHHRSVAHTTSSGRFWARGFWPKGFWAKGMFKEPDLMVELTPPEVDELGEVIPALELAEMVYAYWSDAYS